jgi:hypothetical protein
MWLAYIHCWVTANKHAFLTEECVFREVRAEGLS